MVRQGMSSRVRFLQDCQASKSDLEQTVRLIVGLAKHKYKKSKAVINKSSPLFVGIRALPSFKDRALLPGTLNGASVKMSKLRKKVIAPNATEDGPSQEDAAVVTPPIPPSYWDSPKARGLFQP